MPSIMASALIESAPPILVSLSHNHRRYSCCWWKRTRSRSSFVKPPSCQKMFVPGICLIHFFSLFLVFFFFSENFASSALTDCFFFFFYYYYYFTGFGEASPEAKAATHLHNFFTFLAVKIVLAQLQSYNHEAYEDLMEFISRNSPNDGDKFCANLMRESQRHQTLALRILEVRSAYCKRDFEWDNLKRLALEMVDESNTGLMRDYVLETSHIDSERS